MQTFKVNPFSLIILSTFICYVANAQRTNADGLLMVKSLKVENSEGDLNKEVYFDYDNAERLQKVTLKRRYEISEKKSKIYTSPSGDYAEAHTEINLNTGKYVWRTTVYEKNRDFIFVKTNATDYNKRHSFELNNNGMVRWYGERGNVTVCLYNGKNLTGGIWLHYNEPNELHNDYDFNRSYGRSRLIINDSVFEVRGHSIFIVNGYECAKYRASTFKGLLALMESSFPDEKMKPFTNRIMDCLPEYKNNTNLSLAMAGFIENWNEKGVTATEWGGERETNLAWKVKNNGTWHIVYGFDEKGNVEKMDYYREYSDGDISYYSTFTLSTCNNGK